MSGPNFDHMDEGIYYNREGLKKLQKAIANADDIDWEAIREAGPAAAAAIAAASSAEQNAAEATAAIEVVREAEAAAVAAASEAMSAASTAAAEAAAGVEATATAAAQAVIGSKQDVLTPGTGIKIEGNVISATGGGGGGTSDYNSLDNRPTLGGQTVEGSHDLAYYGIASAADLQALAEKVDAANAILEEV